MAKQFVSAGQLRKLVEILDQKGVTGEGFQERLNSGFLADLFDSSAVLNDRNAFRNSLKLGVVMPETVVLPVDYGQTLDEMIARGNYDWKNENITAKNFPLKGKGVILFEFKTFHFNCDISSEEATRRIEEDDKTNPWTDAGIEHLLSYGTAFPEEQRKHPIVALGSVAKVRGYRRVPYLDRYGSGRGLGLGWHDGDWVPVYRFLAVRIKVSAT